MPPSDNPTRTLPTLYEFFAPGGILARSSLPYEYRSGQLEMAKAVERALEERRHLIVEAGTGTGKTLAYLLPASASSFPRAPRPSRISSTSATFPTSKR
jgi:ATP-dependent DNA helicase DinG